MADKTWNEAAAEIGMSVSWLKKQVTARLVPHQRYGRVVRFTDEQIAAIRAQFAEPVAQLPSVLTLVRRPA